MTDKVSTSIALRRSAYVFRNALKREAPTILTISGALGVISTAVMTGKATSKALYLLEEKEYRLGHELEPRDVIETVWRVYLPSVLLGGLTIAAIFGSQSINARRSATMASLYAISEKTLRTYQDKILEVVGPKKRIDIHEKVIQAQLNDNSDVDNEIILTVGGNHLFYDSLSGRYFKSDMETVKRQVNVFNQTLLTEMMMPLNDFYYLLGLPNIDMGIDVGWNIDNGLLEIVYTTKMAADEKTPCVVMEYSLNPL